MKPANCKVCGKLFLKASLDVCPECLKKEQDLLKNINDYCVDKNVVTFEELSEKFNIPKEKLEKFLLDRKLVQIMDKLELTCKKCGCKFRLITTGKLYCNKCFELMESQVGRVYQ